MANNKGRHGQKNHKGLIIVIVVVLIIAILTVGAVVFKDDIVKVYDNIVGGKTETTVATTQPTTAETATKATTETTPIDEDQQKALDMVKSMTLNDKVCQLIVVTPEQLTGVDIATVAGDTTKEKLEKYPVSGIAYFDKNKEDDKVFKQMVKRTKSFAKTPLFILEDGYDSETSFPYSDLQVTESLIRNKDCDKTAVEAIKNGTQLIMLPKNLDRTIKGITNAVKSGDITEEQLNETVAKVLSVKIKENIIKS